MALAADVSNQYGAEFIGELDGVKEQFFAISNERKIRHPGVEVILESSVGALFVNPVDPT
jgi:LysR family transcriptional activator of nhaA